MFILLHRQKDIDKIQYKFLREITEIMSLRKSRVRNFMNFMIGIIFQLVIYMKKFLHSDWLRAVQFF